MSGKILIYLAMMVGVLAFSGLFIVIFGNSHEVYCVRPAGQNPVCKISTALLGRIPTSSRAVSDVVDGQEEKSCDSDCAYRAVLVTSSGQRQPVNNVFTEGGPVLDQITQIRGFLDGGAPTYVYEEGVSWWVVALSGGVALIGVPVLTINLIGSFLKK